MTQPEIVPATKKRARDSDSNARVPWYRDLRFSIGLFAAPFFFFNQQIIHFILPQLEERSATQAAQAMTFIAGAILLFPLATLIEGVTEYYEHNFHHRHDRNNALLRAGLLHTSFTNFAFLILTVLTLRAANDSANAQDLTRIVQISIAGSIVVSILFNLGIAVFIGGLNFKRHGGRMNFSKELANQDSEMLTIAVVILSLPTLAGRLNISPGLNDTSTYKVLPSAITSLSVIVSVIMLLIYASYFMWTLLKLGDQQGQTSEDVDGDALKLVFRAVNKVFVSQGAVSLYDAIRSPSTHYPDGAIRTQDMHEVQQQMDALDASLEEEEEEERAHIARLKEENDRRERAHHAGDHMPLSRAARFIMSIFAAVFYIVASPIIALYRLVTLPGRWWASRNRQKALRKEEYRQLSPDEIARREQRDERLALENTNLRHEPALQVAGRIVLLLFGGGGAVFVLDHMASSIEGGLVEGLKLNPFFVGFIVLPIASGLVDITTAIRKAWMNDLQNTMAITTGSAVQAALLVGPIILILSRLPFLQLPDIDLVFGLFILALFALIAYFYQIMTVDGETTWFEGAQLLGIFSAVAVVFFLAQKV